jgi:hypothetical protein
MFEVWNASNSKSTCHEIKPMPAQETFA